MTPTILRLQALAGATVKRGEPLSAHTRFGIGGPADIYFETADESAFTEALHITRNSGTPFCVIGDGTNLIVSDDGYRGILLRYRGASISLVGDSVNAQAGATLQSLVDFSVARGLKGLETMTGIPGSVGAAVYGNAGAYGHSISERVSSVRFVAGSEVHQCDNAACAFRYRESVFKLHKDRVILSVTLALTPADAAELTATATRILDTRNRKYPPTMKCAGSIFKNFLRSELPPAVAAEVPPEAVIEGKVPSAWFLERVDAKGMRVGDIQVATYHANLIYNDGQGTARDLVTVIQELKRRVRARWNMEVEEEVQYVGF